MLTSIESRVVPGTESTSERSKPTRRFSSDDLPTFGRPMSAMRAGRWEYLKVNEHEYLFDVLSDERERANLARRHPERLSGMRAAWETWDATMPPIPAEAGVRLVYGKKDMP